MAGLGRGAALAVGGAILLAGTALQVNAAARRVEREHPARGHFVSVDGVRLHVLEDGAGPPVLLLHGNGVTAEDWAASGVMALLARGHRVLAFDRPGYGYSDRPRGQTWGAAEQAALIARAMERLGAGRAVVVGHSWGALVAVALALDHPEAVAGLVLVSGYHYPTPRADTVLFSPPAVPVLGDVIRYTAGAVVGRVVAPAMIRTMFAPRPVPPGFEDAVPRGMMLRPWQVRASAEDAATMTPRVNEAAPRYPELARLPVQILAGVEDRVVDPDRHSARLHGDVPGSALRLVPGAGHMLHHAAPEAVAQAVEAVMREHDTRH